jgi:group I intron endonuclease
MACGIYKIVNRTTNKYYVGSSTNLEHRWWKHINHLNKNSHCNKYLQNSWNKHGNVQFDFVVVKKLNDKICRNELIGEEQSWLNIAKNEPEKTYNLCFVAGGGDTFTNNPNKDVIVKKLKKRMLGIGNPMFGRTHSTETKKSWSVLRKGKFAGKNSPNYGKQLTDDTKRKISISHCKKVWLFASPSGELKKFHNLKLFCNENNLHNGAMGNVFSGKAKHHKGWRRVNEKL